MISQSSPNPSMRSRYNAVAFSSADTASNSFFFSSSFNAAAGFGTFDANPATCDTRLDAMDERIARLVHDVEVY